MGIPEFFGNYIRRSSNTISLQRIPSKSIVYALAIDTPGILHYAAQHTWLYDEGIKHLDRDALKKEISSLLSKSEEERFDIFFEFVTKKILELTGAYNPKVLILAIDGKAPLAKIQQQRKRRYAARQSASDDFSNRFDIATLSPGTEFMIKLDGKLRKWIDDKQQPVYEEIYSAKGGRKIRRTLLPKTVVYSPHTVPGEAEHKIMKIFKSENFAKIFENDGATNDYINIIYGKDADLILLSLLMDAVQNIYVLRDNIYDVIDIEAFKRFLNNEGIVPTDYVILMSFIGNDFIPRHPSFKMVKTTIDAMIHFYKEIKTTVNNSLASIGKNPTDNIMESDGKILWKIFYQLVKSLEATNVALLTNIFINKEEFRNGAPKMLEESFTVSEGKMTLNYEKYDFLWYDNALGIRDTKYKEELEAFTGEELGSNADDDINDMCKNYLKMFSWVQRYYFYGDQSWDVYYPYHHAPLLRDLVKFMEKEENIEILRNTDDVINPSGVEGNYNVLHQLIAIVHPNSSNLIPFKLRKYMNEYNFLSDMFPEIIAVDKDGTRSKMMNNYLMPFADMPRIVAATDEDMKNIDYDFRENKTNTWYLTDSHLEVHKNELYFRVREKEGRSSEGSSVYSSRGRGSGERGSRGRGSGERGSRGRGSEGLVSSEEYKRIRRGKKREEEKEKA